MLLLLLRLSRRCFDVVLFVMLQVVGKEQRFQIIQVF